MRQFGPPGPSSTASAASAGSNRQHVSTGVMLRDREGLGSDDAEGYRINGEGFSDEEDEEGEEEFDEGAQEGES